MKLNILSFLFFLSFLTYKTTSLSVINNKKIARITLKNNSETITRIHYYYPSYKEEFCANPPVNIRQIAQTDSSECITTKLDPQQVSSFFIYQSDDPNVLFPYGLLTISFLYGQGEKVIKKSFSDFFKTEKPTSFTSKFITLEKNHSIIEQS